MKLGLKTKIIVNSILGIILASGMFCGYFIYKTHNILTKELEEKGGAFTHYLAHEAVYGLITNNQKLLTQHLGDFMREEDVLFGVVYNKDGHVVTSAHKYKGSRVSLQEHNFEKMDFGRGYSLRYALTDNTSILNIFSPVMVSQAPAEKYMYDNEDSLLKMGEDYAQTFPYQESSQVTTIGYVQLSLSLDKLMYEQKDILKAGVLITLSIISVMSILSVFFVQYLIKPIKNMAATALHIAEGDLNKRVDEHSSDEIGVLGKSFNYMVDSVEKRNSELAATNEELQVEIFERKHVEEALKKRQQDIEELNASLESRVEEEVAKSHQKDIIMMHQSRLAATGEMIGHIAHQWRQPLNALVLLLYNIQDMFKTNELTEKELSEMVTTGMNLVQKMSTTIDDFRNFFRPTKGVETFSVNQIVKDAVLLLDASFNYYNISIEIQEKDEMTITGLANEYSQVMLNLLSNSKDAIISQKSKGKVTVEIFKDKNNAVVRITDNGGGIPKNILKLLFNPYFTTKSGEEGTGLGLHLSRVIIEEHMKGKIKVENVNGGAQFSVITPIESDTTPTMKESDSSGV